MKIKEVTFELILVELKRRENWNDK